MLRLSLRMTLRDWRSGELRFLLVALALAVASLSAVQFLTDRMGAALKRDAHQLRASWRRARRSPPTICCWPARGMRSTHTRRG